jgi:alanyl-tRNA synthetase
MKVDELRDIYLAYFESKGHARIPNHSLVPENDPTALFVMAGVHPLVPYVLGAPHPSGRRLVNVQKCIRTIDIDLVGDESHLTLIEMLGNWSLGDYFKQGAIELSYEFLTDSRWLGFPVEHLHVTCFAGNETVPRDEEAAAAWRSLGIAEDHIHFLEEDNWWGPAGQTGPCGPTTEMYIDLHPDAGDDGRTPGNGDRHLEIWNDVFMQYDKTREGRFVPLGQPCVDTGMGVERTAAVLQGVASVYDIDVLAPVVATAAGQAGVTYGEDAERDQSIRILVDHVRAAVFMLGDEAGITPSNLGQGYVLRRIIRRAIRHGRKLDIPGEMLRATAESVIDRYGDAYPQLADNGKANLTELSREEGRFSAALAKGEAEFAKMLPLLRERTDKVIPGDVAIIRRAIRHGRKLDIPGEMLRATAESVIDRYGDAYPQLADNGKAILTELSREEGRFSAALAKGEAEFAKMLPKLLERTDKVIAGDVAFRLYDTFGFPLEITAELAGEHGLSVDGAGFDRQYAEHQKRSKAGADKTFKGGLADASEVVQRLHTATHLLHQALRDELGEHVQQKGSNITAERLRFDFSHGTPMSRDQIERVQDTVNDRIADDLPISMQVMKLQDALDGGAIALFGEKYQEDVKVYSIGGYSKEVCGGPHAGRTGELGRFGIVKEQSSSSGVRRIRAVLEPVS